MRMAGMRWMTHLLRRSPMEKLVQLEPRRLFPSTQSVYLQPCLTSVWSCFCHSSSAANKFDNHDSHLSLHLNGSVLNVPYLWLRDHCRCSNCYNKQTFQKCSDTCTLSPDLAPRKTELSEDHVLRLTWPDGHVSEFEMQWLMENTYTTVSRQRLAKCFWDKALMQSEPLPAVGFDFHQEFEEGLKATLFNLLKYGFCLVTGTPATVDATQQVAERICFILETTFGRMWSFTSDNRRADTAYTNLHLQPHNDTTYLTAPAGIQIFHCLKHEGSGGQTLLVDGYQAARTFYFQDPDNFNYLSKAIVPQEYRDLNCHYYSRGSVINVVPGSGEMIQIRFNPYDMAPLDTIPPGEIPRFYQAYGKLMKLLWDENNIFPIKLLPGVVLLIDNWRVLHGRAAFTGLREMTGCYLPRSDWISRAKMLGLD